MPMRAVMPPAPTRSYGNTIFPIGPLDAEADAEARRQREVRAAWREMLNRVEWDHFVGLTSACNTPAIELLREVPRYVRRLEQAARCRVDWCAAVEGNGLRARHLHAVLVGTGRLTTAEIAARWKHGYTRVRCFDASRDGVGYTIKDVDFCSPDFEGFDFRFPAPGASGRTKCRRSA